jgi:hypothetical protein
MSEQPDDRNLLNFIAATVESMRDQMATKSDLARLEAKMEVEFTAVRGDIEQVHRRLVSLERALSAPLGQFDAEMHRLRRIGTLREYSVNEARRAGS